MIKKLAYKQTSPKDTQVTLEKDGIAILESSDHIDFLDLISTFGTPHDHNGQGAYVWDIRTKNKSVTLARSHTSLEFPLHTDCTYEPNPPHYFALKVLQDDKLGGGLNQIIDVGPMLHRLSSTTQAQLITLYPHTVPDEFRKDTETNYLPILFGENRLRFRRECIQEELCTEAQRGALDELDDLIQKLSVSTLHLQPGQILLVDNHRFLHARTEVLDRRRHLQRIRFNIPQKI